MFGCSAVIVDEAELALARVGRRLHRREPLVGRLRHADLRVAQHLVVVEQDAAVAHQQHALRLAVPLHLGLQRRPGRADVGRLEAIVERLEPALVGEAREVARRQVHDVGRRAGREAHRHLLDELRERHLLDVDLHARVLRLERGDQLLPPRRHARLLGLPGREVERRLRVRDRRRSSRRIATASARNSCLIMVSSFRLIRYQVVQPREDGVELAKVARVELRARRAHVRRADHAAAPQHFLGHRHPEHRLEIEQRQHPVEQSSHTCGVAGAVQRELAHVQVGELAGGHRAAGAARELVGDVAPARAAEHAQQAGRRERAGACVMRWPQGSVSSLM